MTVMGATECAVIAGAAFLGLREVVRYANAAHEFVPCTDGYMGEGKTLPVFDQVAYPGGWGSGVQAAVELPSAGEMAGYDSLHVTLKLECPTMVCPPWDHVATLQHCENVGNQTKCDHEIARWITPYGKPGEWTTDITSMLAFLAQGGNQTLHFWTPQAHTLSLFLHLSDKGRPMRPTTAIPLWSGGQFNASYNEAHADRRVTLPPRPALVQLSALVSGHGWGVDKKNCAEFCNSQHQFVVNGQKFPLAFPDAGARNGCRNKVRQGVIPNQGGTWRAGRAGWCPGWHVAPFVANVTDAISPNENVLSYRAFVDERPYSPEPRAKPNSMGIPAEIRLSSYLVVWEHRQPAT